MILVTFVCILMEEVLFVGECIDLSEDVRTHVHLLAAVVGKIIVVYV